MKLSFKRGILIAAFFVALAVLAIVFKPDTVKADEGSTGSNQIVKIKDFDAGSRVDSQSANLVVKSTNSYTVITYDNNIYTIDNANKEISNITTFATNSCYDIYLTEVKAGDSGDLFKIVNADGSQYAGMSDFYKVAGFVTYMTDGTYFYVDSTDTLHVVNANGTEILSKALTSAVPNSPYGSSVMKFGDYFVVSIGENNMILDAHGVDVTPDLGGLEITYFSIRSNYISVRAMDASGDTPTMSYSYFDKSLNAATEADYNADAFPSRGQGHYNGASSNPDSAIAKVAPTGFNYSNEITINGETFATAMQFKDSKLLCVLYDINGNVLLTSYNMIIFTGDYFLATDSSSKVALYTIKASSQEAIEVVAEAAIEGFSAGAKVVDADGNPVELDQVAIKAVQAVQEVVEKAKAALEEKGVVIPTNAHVSIWDIDLTDQNGNVVRLADGSVNFLMPLEKGIDNTNYSAKVYHVLPDGTCEEVKSEWVQQEDGTYRLQVTATSFSPYVVVYSEKSETPSTGDSTNIMMPIVFGAVAVGVLGFVAAKKRQFD